MKIFFMIISIKKLLYLAYKACLCKTHEMFSLQMSKMSGGPVSGNCMYSCLSIMAYILISCQVLVTYCILSDYFNNSFTCCVCKCVSCHHFSPVCLVSVVRRGGFASEIKICNNKKKNLVSVQ